MLNGHRLQHSFTSTFANAVVAIETRQKLTGNLDSKTLQIDTHQDKSLLKESVERMPSVPMKNSKSSKMISRYAYVSDTGSRTALAPFRIWLVDFFRCSTESSGTYVNISITV